MDQQQLYDEIDSLEEENTILKEVRDELMEENERLRKMVRDYKILLEKEVKSDER